MPYIIDADWVIQASAARPQALSVLRRIAPQSIGISIATLGEVYEGVFNSSNPQARLDRFRRFLDPYQVLPINDAIMEHFAEIRAYPSRRGEMISDFDVILGATALHYNLTVLTFNVRHLQRIPDVAIYQIR